MNYIYTLTDPRTNAVRYVGKTDNPERRLKMHIRDKERCHRVHWIRSLLAEGVNPAITVIESMPDGDDWEARERHWIAHYRAQGANLTNGTDGGDQGPDCTGKNLVKSERARANIVAALIRRNKSQKMRAISKKNGMANKGRKQSQSEIKRKREWMTGRKHHTDEFKSALAERNSAREYDPAKMRETSRSLWDDPIKGAQMRKALAERNRKRKKGRP